MEITVEVIKSLRESTGAGIMDCKKALMETQGDCDQATEILRKKGLVKVQKKAERVARQGIVEQYVHGGGRIGAMVEINCETDFVARTDEFKDLAHNVAMQIVAMNPVYITAEDIPQGSEDSPDQVCLLHQPYIRDPQTTIKELINTLIAKVGENIQIKRFVRYELGCWEDDRI